MEAVLPTEMDVHSLRIVLESEIPKVDWLQCRYDQLCMLRLSKAFVKKVKARDLKLGDLVLKEI